MSPGRHNFPSYRQWQCFLGACGKEDFLSPCFLLSLGDLRLAVAGPCTGVVALQKLRCRAAGLLHASLFEGCAETAGGQVWP